MVKNIGYKIVATSKNRIFQFEKTGLQLEEMPEPLNSWSKVWSNDSRSWSVWQTASLARERKRPNLSSPTELVGVEWSTEKAADQAHRSAR